MPRAQVAFTCDQKALVAAGSDQALCMWDLESGRVRHTLTGHSQKVSGPPNWGSMCRMHQSVQWAL